MKKKKFRFDVGLEVQELSSIPLLNGVLFCKIRLIQGGDFSSATCRREVIDHSVKWKSHFDFSCKLAANASTGILETCLCRISIRKEIKGGKSYEKLGYVDVNLAQFAGAGLTSRRYILEGYNDSKGHQQDNSTLTININMSLTSGDPLFKAQIAPQQTFLPTSIETDATRAESESPGPGAGTGCGTAGSDVDLLPRTFSESSRKGSAGSASGYSVNGNHTFPCHKRNTSGGSHGRISVASHSRSSSMDITKRYGSSAAHSRQSSSASDSQPADNEAPLISPFSPINKNVKRSEEFLRKIDDTRVSADDVINQLIQGQDFTAGANLHDEGNQLALFIAKDGTAAALAGYDLQKNSGRYVPATIEEDRFRTL